MQSLAAWSPFGVLVERVNGSWQVFEIKAFQHWIGQAACIGFDDLVRFKEDIKPSTEMASGFKENCLECPWFQVRTPRRKPGPPLEYDGSLKQLRDRQLGLPPLYQD